MNDVTLKQKLLRWRRRLALRVNYLEYCRTGSWQLVEELFRARPAGVFFEAGAHDGWTGSNTYWLEAAHGWRGVLVEPVPALYQACRTERPASTVFHGALVPKAYTKSHINIECSGLVSAVTESSMLCETRVIARKYYSVDSRPTISVPAFTMNFCLEKSGVERLDFVSLDVEGFEEEALLGLDLDKWKPDWMLIECNESDSVSEALRGRYQAFRQHPPRDILFKRLL